MVAFMGAGFVVAQIAMRWSPVAPSSPARTMKHRHAFLVVSGGQGGQLELSAARTHL